MQSTLIHEGEGQRTFALIFDMGDEVMGELKHFAEENRLFGSQFTAVGAFSDATLAFFEWDKRDYKKILVREQVEVLMLGGDIAEEDGHPKVHGHVVLGRSDGSTIGGHLMEAHVRPTLEVVLTESPVHLHRKMDRRSGLALIDLSASHASTHSA